MKGLLEEKIVSKEKIYNNINKGGFYMKKVLVGLTVLTLAVGGYFLYGLFNEKEVLSAEKQNLITIDINPSVGLVVEDDTVVDVLTLNDDAVIAVDDLNMVGMNIDDAIDTYIDTAIEMGYVNELSEENIINVTTYNDDDTNDEYNLQIREKIERKLEERKVVALVIANGLDEELKAKADEYDISYGKMLLVDRAATMNTELTEDELSDMTVKEIQAVIKEKATEIKNQVREFYEENKQEIEAKKEEIKEQAKEKIEEAKQNILNAVENYQNMSEKEQNRLIEEKKEQIKENVEATKEKVQEGTKEIIDSIRERVEEKRGN